MSDILVSIIIPVYHSEGTLPQCLESINNQEFDFLEVIIVDSESSADMQLLARIQNANYLNIPNNNIATKRNHGASLGHGQILLFLDSDCLLPPNFFENLLDIFQNKEVVAAGCHDFKLPVDTHWINFAWQIHLQVWSTHNTAWVPTRCFAVRSESFNLIKGF
ncbi:MAG: glycosyltransferase family A protein, partial [Candidatus Paceibacterota bacterium]